MHEHARAIWAQVHKIHKTMSKFHVLSFLPWILALFLGFCFSGSKSVVLQDELSLEQELLLLVGEAQSSITRVSRLARTIDRVTSDIPQQIRDLGRLGTSGRNSQNVERDLENYINRQFWRSILPKTYTFSITQLDPDVQSGTKLGKQTVLLPHEVFSSLYEEAPELFKFLMYGTDLPLETKTCKQKRLFSLGVRPSSMYV